jgi:nucleoside-diphosphate-sugar epimerase
VGAGIARRAADATDATLLAELTRGAEALFNCANPRYHRWLTDWPPIARSLLMAARSTGATLVTLGNLYAYGPPDRPMLPDDPLSSTLPKARVRAAMWEDALALHRSGEIHAVEVRASDFLGATEQSQFWRAVPRLLAGKSVQVLGDPDAPHTWTFVGDVSRTLVACALDETTWGRPWHVPSPPARSSRQVVDDLADAAGLPRVKVSGVPTLALHALGLFQPELREFTKTMYQFRAPFVMDDQESRARLGIVPTPWPDILEATLAPHRAHDRSGALRD